MASYQGARVERERMGQCNIDKKEQTREIAFTYGEEGQAFVETSLAEEQSHRAGT